LWKRISQDSRVCWITTERVVLAQL
jgi:hypothetical protein